MLAARKLLSKPTAEGAYSPGPPLPISHPKPSLLAKIFIEISSLYQSASSILSPSSSSNKPSSKGGGADLGASADIRGYVRHEGALTKTLVHTWLGVERVTSRKHGESTNYLS